jgi:hypothetical protein
MISLSLEGDLTSLELDTVIRLMRSLRNELDEDRMRLEEREKGIGDGPTREAINHCNAKIHHYDVIIAKLWKKRYPTETHRTTPQVG